MREISLLHTTTGNPKCLKEVEAVRQDSAQPEKGLYDHSLFDVVVHSDRAEE